MKYTITAIALASVALGIQIAEHSAPSYATPQATPQLVAQAPPKAPAPEPSVAKKIAQKNKIQIALLLDTSNSMDGLINLARNQMWGIVSQLSKAEINGQQADIEIALYEYGNDQLSSSKGHIRKVSNFSRDLDLINEKLYGLDTDGGQEYCPQVTLEACRKLEWSKNEKDIHLLIIAGNENFFQYNQRLRDRDPRPTSTYKPSITARITQGAVKISPIGGSTKIITPPSDGDGDPGKSLYNRALRVAKEKDIQIVPIYCGESVHAKNEHWNRAASLADQPLLVLNQDQVVAEEPTPYDDEISRLDSELNKTFLARGSAKQKSISLSRMKQADHASASAGIFASRSEAKASGNYYRAQTDMVANAKETSVEEALETTDTAHLPEVMQSMSKAERIQYLEKNLQKRTQLEKKIQNLNQQRREYLKKNSSQEEGLDDLVIRSIIKDAKAKGYKF